MFRITNAFVILIYNFACFIHLTILRSFWVIFFFFYRDFCMNCITNENWIRKAKSFGILGYLSKKVENTLQPILNIAQTMPHFSYLVPILVLFGIGDHAGAVATIIFATPPMIRLTILGLKKISPEVVESGLMSGCNRFQLLFRVFEIGEKM